MTAPQVDDRLARLRRAARLARLEAVARDAEASTQIQTAIRRAEDLESVGLRAPFTAPIVRQMEGGPEALAAAEDAFRPNVGRLALRPGEPQPIDVEAESERFQRQRIAEERAAESLPSRAIGRIAELTGGEPGRSGAEVLRQNVNQPLLGVPTRLAETGAGILGLASSAVAGGEGVSDALLRTRGKLQALIEYARGDAGIVSPATATELATFAVEIGLLKRLPGGRGAFTFGPVPEIQRAAQVGGRLETALARIDGALARAQGTGLGRGALRGAAEGGQFGAFEQGRDFARHAESLTDPEGFERAAMAGQGGAVAGAAFGIGSEVVRALRPARAERLRRAAEQAAEQRAARGQAVDRAEVVERITAQRERGQPLAQLRAAEEQARRSVEPPVENVPPRQVAEQVGPRARAAEMERVFEGMDDPVTPVVIKPPRGPLSGLTDEQLAQRLVMTEAQIEREGSRAGSGHIPFARQGQDLGPEGFGVVTGNVLTGDARRALGRHAQASRRADAALAELRRRGFDESGIEGLRESAEERLAILSEPGLPSQSFRPGDLLRSERGAIAAAPDPLEVRPDLSRFPDHTRRILRQISVGERTTDPLKDRVLQGTRDLYTEVVRRTAPLERATRALSGGAPLRAANDPGAIARLASGSARRAEGFLEQGPVRWTRDGNLEQTGTPAYEQIIAPASGRLTELRAYELAARTVEVSSRKIKTGVSVEDAQRQIADADDVIRQAHEQSVQYRADVFAYWRDAGGISPQGYEAARALGEHYIPLQRVFEGRTGGGAGSVGRVRQQVQRLVGSGRQIVDPIESTVEQTRRLIRAADINRVALTLVELAETFPAHAAGFLERVGGRGRLSEEGRRLQQAAKTQLNLGLSDDVAEEVASQLGPKGLISSDGTFRIWRNGKSETWRAAPEITRAIQALSPQDVPFVVRLLGLPAQTMKHGITLNPLFGIFNFVRDSFDAAVQSQYGFRLGIDSFVGAWHSMREIYFGKASKLYREFVQGGGGFSTFRGAERRDVQAQLRRLLPEPLYLQIVGRAGGPVVGAGVGAALDTKDRKRGALLGAAAGLTLAAGRRARIWRPLEALQEFNRPLEEAARVGEFIRARKARAPVMDAILAQQDVTVDFLNRGASGFVQGLNYMTAFLNPATQSLDRFVRVVAKNPTRAFAAAITTISMPSLLFWAANHDDQEINDLRKTNAGLIYWFLRSPSGQIMRIPKPFLWGQIFGTGMEAALDRLRDDDPDAARRFAHGVLDQTKANILPNVLQLYLSQKFNRDLFFDSPIVPPELAGEGFGPGVDPRFQARERTGAIARVIGDRFNISPARIEKVWRDLSGTLGAEVLRLGDRGVAAIQGEERTQPTPLKGEWPLLGRFFARVPSTNVQPVQQFYRDASEIARINNTFRFLERNQPTRLANYADEHAEMLALVPLYADARDDIRDLREDMELVIRSREFSADEKRTIIDALVRQIVERARAINDAVPAPPNRRVATR